MIVFYIIDHGAFGLPKVGVGNGFPFFNAADAVSKERFTNDRSIL